MSFFFLVFFVLLLRFPADEVCASAQTRTAKMASRDDPFPKSHSFLFFYRPDFGRRATSSPLFPWIVTQARYLGLGSDCKEAGDKKLLEALAYMMYDHVGRVVEAAIRKRTGGRLVSGASGESSARNVP